jgi:ABC-type dipeptide/oligopeptide/nickel transport system ATPase component
MATLLEAIGLDKSYVAGHGRCWARVQVLSALSLTLAEGERVAVLGGRGAGKTTLLHCLTGLRRPDAGSVRWTARRAVPYALCARPADLFSGGASVLLELPDESRVAGEWIEALHHRRASSMGWLVLTSRLAPLLPLCHRALELHDGALRPIASPSPLRVAETGRAGRRTGR